MKQGKHYLSIVIWIFLAAIVAYFGYNLATSLYTPLTTHCWNTRNMSATTTARRSSPSARPLRPEQTS